jgi:DNA-binding NarL/FixJ family response regulator
MSQTKVLLVDDHCALLEAIAHRFEAESWISVEGRASTSAQALALLPGRTFDIAVLDLDLRGDSGVELGSELRERCPGIGLVAMTASESIDDLVNATRAGFRGWVPKCRPFGELVRAVRGVSRGETVVPSAHLTPLLERLLHQDREKTEAERRLSALTVREREVLELMTRGRSRREIATELVVSLNTVRTHMQSILTKLDVHSAVAAAAILLGAESAGTDLPVSR